MKLTDFELSAQKKPRVLRGNGSGGLLRVINCDEQVWKSSSHPLSSLVGETLNESVLIVVVRLKVQELTIEPQKPETPLYGWHRH